MPDTNVQMSRSINTGDNDTPYSQVSSYNFIYELEKQYTITLLS